MNAFLLPFIGSGQIPVLGATRHATILVLCTLLLGCNSINAPPAEENSDWVAQRDRLQQLETWELRGRVDVRYDNDSHTPRIQWQQQVDTYRIRLWGSFNAGNTIILGRPGHVTMEQDGQVVSATSPEDLILEQLGYELPVSHLEFWIRGLPAPGSRANLEFNDLNQLVQLNQAGWTVTYSDPRLYGDIALPARMELTRPENDIQLRFIGLNWTLGSAVN